MTAPGFLVLVIRAMRCGSSGRDVQPPPSTHAFDLIVWRGVRLPMSGLEARGARPRHERVVCIGRALVGLELRNEGIPGARDGMGGGRKARVGDAMRGM